MNSGKIVAGRDGTGGRDGTSKVLQEVLADLKISHHVDQGMKRAGEATKGMKRSMWRTDNAKYGTSHISDVPLDLVNNSISTAEANK